MAGQSPRLTPDLLLGAYARGIFPMAEARGAETLHWFDPQQRGILPLDGFHVSRSLARSLRRPDHRVSADTAFSEVVAACADREETWINAPLARLYEALHAGGHAHSIEVRDLGGRLVGGIFGVALGGAFFGESMFSRRTDGSKIALAHLVARLGRGGFTLFDTQYLTPHLASLGGVEIPRAEYRRRLARALAVEAGFGPPGPVVPLPPQPTRQRSTQTS